MKPRRDEEHEGRASAPQGLASPILCSSLLRVQKRRTDFSLSYLWGQTKVCPTFCALQLRAGLWCLTILLLLGCCSLTRAQDSRATETRQSSHLAPGLEHLFIKRGDFQIDKSDRWLINVLLVDAQQVRLQLGLAMDEIAGSELTSSLAARHGALAAINGGYFRTTGIYRGEQVGTLVLNGKLLSEPNKNRASLAVAERGGRTQAAVVNVQTSAELKLNGQPGFPVSGFNRPREKDELIVFTPEFHRTTLTSADGVEAVVLRNRIVNLHEGAGSQPIPPGGFVLSAHGAARAWLRAKARRGARVEIKTTLSYAPALAFKADFILGGGPRLLQAGKLVETEAASYAASFYKLRHPRTALGWRADGQFVLVTVDGRQPQQSVGMTIPELAALMQELGCVEALNLDGGGSTTMVIQNKVVNSPSDATGERAVSDALLLFPQPANNEVKR
jgi:exopolysaccharide biosynthesis protein